jgi:hypothetical protein
MKWQNWLAGLMGMIALSAGAEAPSGVSVRGIRAFGQGCPIGSANAVISPDGQAFSLLLDNYSAVVEAGGRPTVRRDCDIEVDLNIPAGWSFAVVAADYRGFIDIAAGSLVQHRVMYTFDKRRRLPGEGYDFSFQGTEFRGPKTEEYNIHHEIGISQAPRSSCSFGQVKTLFLNTLLTARAMRGRGEATSISLDSVDGQLAAQQYRLAWFRCDQFDRPGNGNPGGGGPGRPPRPTPPGRRWR